MEKKIVIVGAGYSGILSAKRLAKSIKKMKKTNEVEITIIDKNPFHTMLTELHEVAAMRTPEENIKINLKRVFAGRNVNVVMDKISEINYHEKKVVGEHNSYDYDFLVMASGSKPTFRGIEGSEKYTHTLWSYEDAVNLKNHIVSTFYKASKETDIEKMRDILRFYVIGTGFTGVEMAGELAEVVPILCEKYEIDRNMVQIVNVDMVERVCSVLPEKLSIKIEKRLNKMNVQVKLSTKVLCVGEDFIQLSEKGESPKKYNSSTIIWTAGIEGSEVAKSSQSLGVLKSGRIETDEYLRSKNDKNVYIAGDNIYYIPEGESSPVPQMVENCEACAKTIANNLLFDLLGKGKQEKYTPKFHGMMVSIGGRYGVARVGLPKKMLNLPSLFAMFSKHFINIIYLVQVLGWNKIASYLKYEFFTIKDDRSFVGGHLSNKSPTFLLAPLRVFLGFTWLFEGVKKVNEGWLNTPKLESFFGGANQFFESILNQNATASDTIITATNAATTVPMADATSSATGEVANVAGQVILDWNFFDFIRISIVNAGEVAAKVQVSIVDFIVNSVVLASDSSQMFFQITIVIAEILIGLGLMAGLFTTASAAASLVLLSMFLTSTGLFMSTWWMVFAGIAMLFGAGRVFGLDYYAMPWLKKRWKNTKIAKKWYLYHD